jgi:hypothetical protein
MSRRTRTRAASPPAKGPPERSPEGRSRKEAREARPQAREARPRSEAPRLPGEIAFLVAVFAVTALVAKVAGAANLGVALGIGQVAFVIALVAVLLRR